MMARLRSLLVPAVLTIFVGGVLVSLGIWQLHRLSWKTELLARIEARTRAAPQPLPPSGAWASLKPPEYDYRRVALDGVFRRSKNAFVFHGAIDGPGYLVMTPLDLKDGTSVIVNRGFIPADLKDKTTDAFEAPTGQVHLIGVMRRPETRNFFTPADETSKSVFFTRDPRAIAERLGLVGAAPFIVDAERTGAGWPRENAAEPLIPNNHLSYALTWFGLALALVGVFSVFAWRGMTQSPKASRDSGAQAAAVFRR